MKSVQQAISSLDDMLQHVGPREPPKPTGRQPWSDNHPWKKYAERAAKRKRRSR